MYCRKELNDGIWENWKIDFTRYMISSLTAEKLENNKYLHYNKLLYNCTTEERIRFYYISG